MTDVRQPSVPSSQPGAPMPPPLSSWSTNEAYSVPVLWSAASHGRSHPILCGPGPEPGAGSTGPAGSGALQPASRTTTVPPGTGCAVLDCAATAPTQLPTTFQVSPPSADMRTSPSSAV